MNLSQKWKRFWTLNPKANAGFTLVELIVVIAIVAILGGVAVPAYSGYMEKSKRAGDEVLLAAVNKGFASACVSAGSDIYLIDEAALNMADGKVEGVNNAAASVGVLNLDDLKEAFLVFYVNENPNAQFEVIESLVFDAGKHMFVDPATATEITLGYNGAKVTITGEQIQILKDSTYFGEGMTSEKLLNQVDGAALVAGGLSAIGDIQSTPEFLAFAAGALGLESAADLPTELFNLANEALGGNYASYEEVPEELAGDYADMMAQIQNNAMILYTAEQTNKLSADEASKLLEGVGTSENYAYEEIQANMKSTDAATKQKGLSQAALAYGMYYAYVNSEACTDPNVEKENILPLDVIDALNTDKDFQDFMKSEQGQKDMEAYLEALSIVNDGAQSPDAVEKLVTSGFGDLTGLLEGTMGK